jgi:anti-sigma factor RsiW
MLIDEAMLMAYADGEVSGDMADAIAQAIAADPALAARVADYRRVGKNVHDAYADVLAEPVPERLLALFAADKVVRPAAWRQRVVTAFPGSTRGWMQIAATLMLGIVVGRSVDNLLPARPIVIDGGTMVASGDLAHGLSTVGGGEPAQGGVRVGFTFASARAICRTFRLDQAQPIAGVACRDGDRWRVETMAQAGPRMTGDFRTAGNEMPAAVLAAVDDLIVGEAFTPDREQQAMHRSWERDR